MAKRTVETTTDHVVLVATLKESQELMNYIEQCEQHKQIPVGVKRLKMKLAAEIDLQETF